MDFTVFGLIAFVAIVVINFIAIRRAHRFAALHARLLADAKPIEKGAPEPEPFTYRTFTYRNPEPLPPGRPARQLPGPPTSQLR